MTAPPPHAAGEVRPYSHDEFAAPLPRQHERAEDIEAFKKDIDEHGQLVPVVLAFIAGVLTLVDGYRRVAALKALGVETVLAYVDERITTHAQAVAFLFKSEARAGRHFLDLARRAAELIASLGCTQAECARLLGISPARCSQLLLPLNYRPEVRALFESQLTLQHAVVLASLPLAQQEEWLVHAADKELSSGQLKALAFPKRKKSNPATLRVPLGPGTLSFPASTTVGELVGAIDRFRADVAERVKQSPKSRLSARDLFTP